MVATIQCYIKHRKDIDVEISLNMPYDLPKLMIGYNIANDWLIENNVKITKLD